MFEANRNDPDECPVQTHTHEFESSTKLAEEGTTGTIIDSRG
jgi:hypothetical protein